MEQDELVVQHFHLLKQKKNSYHTEQEQIIIF